MSKLPSITPRKLIKILSKMGFVIDHQTGSHVTMRHPITRCRAVIPYHNKDIPKGTLSAILRESGISKQEILKV